MNKKEKSPVPETWNKVSKRETKKNSQRNSIKK